MTTSELLSIGYCICGCAMPVGSGAFFALGHDEKADAMLTRLEHGDEQPIGMRIAAAGYGFGGKNLLANYKAAAAQLDIHGFMISMPDVKVPKDIKPTGKCNCGCDEKTNPDSFFLAGHDKKAESMLTKLEYGEENSVAQRLAHAGYGPGGKNLLEEYRKMKAASAADRMEFFALQSLQDMASKPGIVDAVVFIGPPGSPALPSKTPAGLPQPEKTNSLDVPFRGTVVAQGFAQPLSDKEKEIVQARFKGRPFMWLGNT